MHKNNFDFLRLIFALSVIVTHSFPLTGLNEWEHDWLSRATHGQVTFSYFGVRGFFIISGFLVYQSMTRSTSLVDYFWKRILRLYPALIAVLLITVILAYFPFSGDLQSYLHNRSVTAYFTNNITLFNIQYAIDGVFQDNPVTAINGSLWTIPYEFFFYMLIGLLWLFRKRGAKYFLFAGLLLALILHFSRQPQTWKFMYLDAKYIFELGIFFFSGAAMAALDVQKYPYKKILFLTGVFVFLLAIRFQNFYIFQFLALPLIVIPFGLASTVYLRDLSSRVGDLSYGIYIYGYPVQQTLRHYFNLDYLPMMIYSCIVVIIIGFFSWHLIEKRALRLKRINVSSIFGMKYVLAKKTSNLEDNGNALIERN